MRRRQVLTLGLLLGCASTSTRALPAARAVAKRYAEAIVTVRRETRVSQGFFVSSTGLACTVVPGAALRDAVTIEGEHGPVSANVVAVDHDGLALVAPLEPFAAPVTALAVQGAAPAKDAWLVGLARERRGVMGVVGGVEGDDVALVPVPRGAPLLDGDQVVYVAQAARGGGRVALIGAARVRALATRFARAEGGQ